MTSPRVVIIGAGPGGLASAMLLAASGCDVTVLERRDRVGGRTSSITEAGFTFDVGPTFFLYPRVLEEVFAACGKSLNDEVELVRLDPQYHLVFEQGGELRATHEIARMREQLARFNPHDATQFERFLNDNRAKLAAFRAVLESPFESPLDLLRPSVLKALPRLHPLASVHVDLCRYFKDPRTRLAFSFQSKYLGMSPFQCPSLFTILSFLEYEYGVWHPIGGCNAVMEAMARVARSMGVKIVLNAEVTKLDFQDDPRREGAAEDPSPGLSPGYRGEESERRAPRRSAVAGVEDPSPSLSPGYRGEGSERRDPCRSALERAEDPSPGLSPAYRGEESERRDPRRSAVAGVEDPSPSLSPGYRGEELERGAPCRSTLAGAEDPSPGLCPEYRGEESEVVAGARSLGVSPGHRGEKAEPLSPRPSTLGRGRVRGPRIRSVTTRSNETYACDAVVINSDFANTMRKLVPDAMRTRWSDRAIDKKKFSCSTFMMYLGIEGPLPELEHHTIWLAHDYEENLLDIESRHRLSSNPSFYVQNACRTDPSLAPDGCSTLYCLFPVTHDTGSIDWASEAPLFREAAYRHLKKLGLGDIKKRVRFEKTLTPADWANDFQLFRGATFNLAHNLGQMLHKRPHNRFEELDNVYLVGGGTHPGSGLPVIFESARISSRLLLEDHRVPFHWPGQTGEAARYAKRNASSLLAASRAGERELSQAPSREAASGGSGLASHGNRA